ncbi:unnamed protein product [Rhizophagus irregularis]|nr:unnamed protein product [Rhizophagus irregularis]
MMWKNGYWSVNSCTKIRPNDKIKQSYIMYKSFNFLLYITLHTIATFHLSATYTNYHDLVSLNVFTIIFTGMGFFSLFTLTFSFKIIKRELKFRVFLIYITLIVQGLCSFFFYYYFWNGKDLIGVIIILILLVFTFINTILCHRNFGKSHILLIKFNPNLDKDYEYSDDLDDDEEEEEKDEKISEILNRYWKFIKESFNSLVQE